ncbi:MAG: hypothetical protein LBQ81_05535 [Zoogloeaceae bacterium]|jgi:hypothetical protein|nr:hypothetical protein [Zoogloeaceae bacterium]
MASADETTTDKRYWHIRLHKNLTLTLVGLFLLAALAKVALDSREMYERRARASGTLVAAIEARKTISQQLEANPHASIAASTADLISDSPFIAYKTVAHDGTIVAFSQRTGTLIVFHPLVGADGKVDWTCWGASAYGDDALPPTCRILPPEQ